MMLFRCSRGIANALVNATVTTSKFLTCCSCLIQQCKLILAQSGNKIKHFEDEASRDVPEKSSYTQTLSGGGDSSVETHVKRHSRAQNTILNGQLPAEPNHNQAKLEPSQPPNASVVLSVNINLRASQVSNQTKRETAETDILNSPNIPSIHRLLPTSITNSTLGLGVAPLRNADENLKLPNVPDSPPETPKSGISENDQGLLVRCRRHLLLFFVFLLNWVVGGSS